ncbi:glycoside hydrolase family 3 N-terminal domain-containing protein [Rhodococcus sp. IEGM 1408]|uniref:glycoside hydrolase family 3 N-terminal domain-containing protein n=1 Tax=Rhodococcus sp. IEGM 1408 TaxID=3082220 RepID=UPI002953B858|nr:glycoside hydrolase family 3 N-terminal domain-containing protein [Rhodococcus sp. IEGM 1408]MDV7999722.1 glycoside hydrolase family 3 N-terminal domain-containing protein [Rhodococcus sp. IEGM 1408]
MPLTHRRPLTVSVLVAALVVAGCGADQGDDRGADRAATPVGASSPATSAPAAAEPLTAQPVSPLCESPLDSLTQRERIAQLFTVGVSSMADARRAVDEHNIGGIFLGGGVVREAVSGDGLKRLLHDTPLPLLVAIDEEGGRVSRIAPFAGPLPSARVMAATMSPEEVRSAARARGEFLREMGVTVDFAPSVDVSDQPDEAVIGDRSFSPDPARVVHYARAFATGLLDAGVTPVFKHFPGHGRSSGDSHHQSVTVPPLDQLVLHDLRPFSELAETPGAAMMLGHPQVPGLTGVNRPASLSPAAYRLLREGHGYGAPPFDGVIFTDDLSGMRAVTNDFPLPQAVAESLVAGADSPLWTTTAGIPAALDAVEKALADGALDKQDLDRSLARVATLRGIPDCANVTPAGEVAGQVEGAGSLAGLSPGLPRHPGLPALPG